MQDITEDDIRSAFGERTFSRGQDYFENGHVECGMKRGDSLIGKVSGTTIHPYKVEVELNDRIYSECSCPVGGMCKHGVALLLQWVNDRDLFVDYDDLLVLLREKSKEELIKIVGSVLEDDPALALRLAFSEETAQKRINIEALSKKLRYLGRDLDYYAVSGIAEELETVKERADSLAREGHYDDAVAVYLLVIEWGIGAFEDDVDDSDGELGDAVIACVEGFNAVAEIFEEEKKRDLIYRILKIVEVEDYGLETEEMLFSLATEKNVAFIEKELVRRISASGKRHSDYQRGKVLNMLSRLYGKLGMQEDFLRVMKEVGLENENDYVRMAETLIKLGAHEEAFHYVREGLQLKKERNSRLNMLYFTLLHKFLVEEKREDIKVSMEEMITIALQMLYFSFDSESYSIIKEVFERIGKHDKFISAIKRECKDVVVIDVLLYENRCGEAIERALSSSTLHPGKIMEVAGVAKEKRRDETMTLVGKAVKKGLSYVNAEESELLEFFVIESDEKELKNVIECIRYTLIARIFVSALMKRNQEFALKLLKTFLHDIGKEEVKAYAMKLEDTYAKELCHCWVSAFISRSYVYYDDVIDVLKALKRITGEEEWNNYISMLTETHKGKRKLMEKIRKLNW